MCINFYLLKKMFISLTTLLGPSLQSVLYTRAPPGPVSLFSQTRTEAARIYKL